MRVCFDAKVVDACAHVSEQIAVVSIVFAMFALVKTEKVRAEEVLGWSVSCAVLGMMCMEDDDDDDDDDDDERCRDDKKKTKKKTEKKNRYVTLLKRRIRLGVGVALAVAISSPLFLTMILGCRSDTPVRGCRDSRFCPSRDARLSRGKHEFRERFRRGEFSVGDF